tara:strand:- start:637 stop:762 length:126 start_codon:yes stop_codon:yes gene_type:complete
MNRRDIDWADVLILCGMGAFILIVSLELFGAFLSFLAQGGV